MSDAYLLLLTAILILPVVALLAFVGCGFTAGNIGTFSIAATPGDGEVIISWPPDISADRFEVKRGVASGVLLPIDEVFGGAGYRDGTVTNGTEYFYAVSKWIGAYEMVSNEITATPNGPIPPPPVLTAFVTGKTLGNTLSAAGWFGMAIMVGSRALIVRTLGRAYAPGNNQTHPLRLIDASASMDVAGVDVTMTAGVVGDFQYAPLTTAVTLAPNKLYYLVSEEKAGVELFHNHTTTVQTSQNPNVGTVTGAVIGDGTTHSIDSTGSFAYGPLNFQFDGP